MTKSDFNSLSKIFSDEDAARDMLEKMRWPDGAICPHCGNMKAYKLTAKEGSKSPVRKGVYKCAACRKQFTVKVGTIFEDSHIALNHWLYAIYQMCASKKGISAHQLHRTLGITYKSAWFMCHRIRYAMTQSPLVGMLGNIVEVDETYVGGKPRKTANSEPAKKGRGTKKIPVVAAVERDGKVRATKMKIVNAKNMREHLHKYIDRDARIMTDGLPLYPGVILQFRSHEVVNHAAGEYARGDVNTNTVESYFALLKRGIIGTFHHVSEQHLDKYVGEFAFRWDFRKSTDMERTIEAVKAVKGKRLMYKMPVGK
jgi:transposase-like protein